MVWPFLISHKKIEFIISLEREVISSSYFSYSSNSLTHAARFIRIHLLFQPDK